ncbi:MAG: SCP2 sterol-binding domain-containing protein [Myxococcales bacterium]|nr:SCP2 sterol-binding domain-containing protein [Myxococcales bacterium]
MSRASAWLRSLPALFDRGVKLLSERAAGGDAAARARLDDVMGARGCALFRMQAEPDLWLAVEEGRMTMHEGRPGLLPVRLAVAVSAADLDALVDWLTPHATSDAADERAAVRATALASATFERLIGTAPVLGELRVVDTPDERDVCVRFALGADEPPTRPPFTASIAYDDLVAMRDGRLDVGQAVLSQRIRLAGDYSRALQLAMQIMALRPRAGRR